MYAYIKGKLIASAPSNVIIEAGGIGYRIYIPATVYADMPHQGNEVQLQLSYVVREQSQTLYGFNTNQDRDFFEALLNVSGIGPKIALSLVGHMPLQDMHRAITQGDTTTLTRVPGIGKKTAERLIIEMRDKLAGLQFGFDPSDLAVHSVADFRSQKISDAMSALINLGYNQLSAQKAIKKSLKDQPEEIELAELITSALKHVS